MFSVSLLSNVRFATSDGFFRQLNSIRFLYSDGGIPVCFLNEVENPATVSNPTFFASSFMDKFELTNKYEA